MDFAYGPELRRRITDRLNQFSHQPLDHEGLCHAAVGVVIIGGGEGGQGRVLLGSAKSFWGSAKSFWG